MPVNYLVWTAAPIEHSFALHRLSDVPDFYEIVEGVPRAAGFPVGVTHTVSKDYPHDMLQQDVFRSPHRVFLTSTELKVFLGRQALKNVEFLPVTLLDHRSKPVGNYFILHPIDPVDCLDVAASQAKPNPVDKDYFYEIKQIVLKPEKVNPQLEIFRIKGLFDQIIIRRDLAAAMDAQGFTGVAWTELAAFHRP
jgi:hypothetical protein